MHKYQEGKIINCVAPTGGVVSGVPALVSPFVVIPSATVTVGKTFAGESDGVFPVIKAAGFAVPFGAIAYFDFVTDKKLKATGFPIGRYIEAAGSDATRAIVLLTPELTAQLLAQQVLEFTLVPPHGVAASRDFIWTAPAAGEFDTTDEVFTSAKPSSALGSVVETITNLTGTVNILDAANIDLEGLTDGTAANPTLSATVANRRFAAGDRIRFRQTSNNADVVAGAGVQHRFPWTRIF